ncbi:MAG: hypothetical protein JNN13_09650 [Planctomycetes bacterium]|nr:hypothetical protein [Planctomycetota bacterium]
MIRGPILPQLREGLWSIVSHRLTLVEHGLELVMEGLDCSGGQLGVVDGLARDAAGAPVLVLLAVDGDALLIARTLAVADFAARVGEALAAAVPEARFCAGALPRVIVVGTEASRSSLEQVARLPIPGLQVCRLEPFRIAGSERFAVLWMTTAAAGVVGAAQVTSPPREFAVPAGREAEWRHLREQCQRIDPGVRFDGDRHWQRITWNGSLLGELWSERDALFGRARLGAADPLRRELRTETDLRQFTDRLLRAFSLAAGLEKTSAAPEPAPASERLAATRHAAAGRGATPAGESLRSMLATMRLSPEEYSALGGTALAAGEQTEAAVVADRAAAVDAARSPAKPA